MHANAAIQSAAKAVLDELATQIGPESTEATVAAAAQAMLSARGYPRTWYHECPALVLLGSRSCLSISGQAYLPADEPVGQFNLVTVDLSPRDGALWGDCGRSFCVEDGVVVQNPRDPELAAGLMYRVMAKTLALIYPNADTPTPPEVTELLVSLRPASGEASHVVRVGRTSDYSADDLAHFAASAG
jgi:hypothetical protein